MSNRLVRRKTKTEMEAGSQALTPEEAMVMELERQRAIEMARQAGIQQRQVAVQSSSMAWPATYMKQMESHYGKGIQPDYSTFEGH
jgi:hypothetical protein